MDGARCVSAASLLLLLLLAVVTATADTSARRCRVEDCPNFRTIRYYEELGCVRSDGSSECCATRFDCSSLLSPDKTKCYYRGKTYEPGTEIGDDRREKCIPSCTCRIVPDESNGEEATFLCPGTDCGIVGVPSGREAECYMTDGLDACCPTGVRCVNDTDIPPAECSHKGKTYREDQRIDGTYSECKKCVCQEGFDGTLDGPWCKKEVCEYSLFHRPSEIAKCAPIFREDDNCCAYRFHCPSADDNVVRSSKSATENKGGQCSFGEHKLNIGDELLVGTDGCVKCRCDVPPFITCTQRPECGGFFL
ncbi:uncharacterized protein LOC126336483 [Schistocerca gregaria]|uniref:uncharacterized protein LOC126336483 n=1 Tax=Schistocerca gregaria TaxID=7010 RepID=UPI00211F0645|nr:uncharacterized protein LOC126336483 [Schistocerca gregaria]